jgi:membrane associated rhomboid family serine protease
LGEMLEGNGMASLFQIGHACHLGGGLAGWMLGRWILRPRITKKRLRRDRERQEAIDAKRNV